MQKTSAVTTWGGIMAAVGGAVALAPLAVLQAYAVIVKDGPPHWFTESILPTMIFGIVVGGVGKALGGWASAGQDEKPTIPEVEAATAQKLADEAAAKAKGPITPLDPNEGGK